MYTYVRESVVHNESGALRITCHRDAFSRGSEAGHCAAGSRVMCKTCAHHGTRIRQRKKVSSMSSRTEEFSFPRRGGARRRPNPTPQHARVRGGGIFGFFFGTPKTLAPPPLQQSTT